MPKCVVLQDELRGDRRGEAQREGRRSVQIVIRERPHRGGRLATVPAQEFERGGLRYPRLVAGMFGIHLGDTLPRDVRNGLAALSGRAGVEDWVLVHDAARPCVSRQDVDRLLDRVQSHPVGGLLAAPAADTLKRAGGEKEVLETVDRASLWRALTPQMFRYGRLCEALDRALGQGRSPTDEAQALEWMGERPLVVEGSTTNIKITSADDLVIAVALMAARSGVGQTGEDSENRIGN